jgi:hypothetical protein
MNTPKPKASWFDLITPALLGRIGGAPSSREGADYAQQGNSICTSRHPGNEPPDEAITTIARIR